jgi:hypothetical protein
MMMAFLCLGFADYVSHEAERIWFSQSGDSGGVRSGDGVGGVRGLGSLRHRGLAHAA